MEVPVLHNVDALRNLLPAGWTVTQEHLNLAALKEWAVEARYPGEWPETTRDDRRRAVVQARAVFDCIIKGFGRRGVKVVPG